MAGAFNAVADDATSLFWNPAGLSQIKGFEGYFEFDTLNGSENFHRSGRNGFSNSSQLYPFSRSTPQSLAVAYGVAKSSNSFCVSFGWRKNGPIPHIYDLEQPEIIDLITINTQIQTNTTRHLDGDEETFLFGFGTSFSEKYMFGFRMGVLRGKINEVLENHNVSFQDGVLTFSQSLRETSQEEIRGTSFTISFLSKLSKTVSIGGNFDFPYSRKSERNILQDDFITDPFAYSESLEVSVPWAMDVGVSVRMNQSFLVAGSFGYSPWKDVCIGEPGGSCSIPYPIQRYYQHQSSLNQWRIGGEYKANNIAFRAGFLIDDQPYTNSSFLDSPFASDIPIEDTQFYGYTFGAGYKANAFNLDFGFVREQGKARAKIPFGTHIDRSQLQTDLEFHHNRFLFGIGFHH